MSITIKAIFPKAVGFKSFEAGFTAKQKNFIFDLEKLPNVGNNTSRDRYLTKHKILSNFTDFCLDSINSYFYEVYKPKYDVKLRITQMWANFNNKNQWHHSHEHPNSFLSAVYYMHCTENVDKIIFSKKEYQQLLIHSSSSTEYNNNDIEIPIKENLLVIFPSSLTHQVNNNQTDKTRVSISMNTFPVGILGNGQECTECVLK